MSPTFWARTKRFLGDRAALLLPARWRVRAALRGYPRTLIAAVREGERVKVVGQIRAVAPLIKSPITGQPCVFYSLSVKEVIGPEEEREITLASDERCCDFAVIDASGEALVEADGAEMNIPSFWEDRHHPEAERIARESPFITAGPYWEKRIRYQEAMLCPGSSVAVLGTSRAECRARTPREGRSAQPACGRPSLARARRLWS